MFMMTTVSSSSVLILENFESVIVVNLKGICLFVFVFDPYCLAHTASHIVLLYLSF